MNTAPSTRTTAAMCTHGCRAGVRGDPSLRNSRVYDRRIWMSERTRVMISADSSLLGCTRHLRSRTARPIDEVLESSCAVKAFADRPPVAIPQPLLELHRNIGKYN